MFLPKVLKVTCRQHTSILNWKKFYNKTMQHATFYNIIITASVFSDILCNIDIVDAVSWLSSLGNVCVFLLIEFRCLQKIISHFATYIKF